MRISSAYVGMCLGTALLATAAPAIAAPISQTFKGTLASDDAVATFQFTLTETHGVTITTDSYGGGENLDGTTTPAGGFVPIIALFSPTGMFIADDGADPNAPGKIDPVTGISDDAAFTVEGLAAGAYTLTVSEFFNFPNGNLSDGFFQTGTGNFTGPTCSLPSGAFIQTDLTTCPQRTDAFSVNLATVPESGTLALLTGGLFIFGMARVYAPRRVRVRNRA